MPKTSTRTTVPTSSQPLQTAPNPINNLFNQKVLIILLIVVAYLLGVQTTKVSYLEKVASNQKTAGAASQTTANDANPQQPSNAEKVTPVSDSDHVRGNKDAKIALIEYSDAECPFCKRFHPTMQEILKEYGDKVKWVYRHFPLSFHANAQKEAEASECVAEFGDNDKFWEYIDKIFERTTSNGTGFALDQLGPLAAEVGVDQNKFQNCLDSGKYEKLVKDQMADGTKAGVNGTPSTFVVNAKGESQIVVGAQPKEAIKTIIDQYLEQKY